MEPKFGPYRLMVFSCKRNSDRWRHERLAAGGSSKLYSVYGVDAVILPSIKVRAKKRSRKHDRVSSVCGEQVVRTHFYDRARKEGYGSCGRLGMGVA